MDMLRTEPGMPGLSPANIIGRILRSSNPRKPTDLYSLGGLAGLGFLAQTSPISILPVLVGAGAIYGIRYRKEIAKWIGGSAKYISEKSGVVGEYISEKYGKYAGTTLPPFMWNAAEKFGQYTSFKPPPFMWGGRAGAVLNAGSLAAKVVTGIVGGVVSTTAIFNAALGIAGSVASQVQSTSTAAQTITSFVTGGNQGGLLNWSYRVVDALTSSILAAQPAISQTFDLQKSRALVGDKGVGKLGSSFDDYNALYLIEQQKQIAARSAERQTMNTMMRNLRASAASNSQ